MSDVLEIPELSLVVLVGPTSSGKSTFARRCFAPTEILASDRFRAMVADDENDQTANADAFDLLHAALRKRLARGRLTVVDATNVERNARASLVRIAVEHDVLPVAVVLDVPARVCMERHAARDDRPFGREVVRLHRGQLRRSLPGLKKEGFRRVHVLRSVEEVDAAKIVRTRLWCDRRDDRGPFDVIGDVHGCADELGELLARLGYARDEAGVFRHPQGRRAIFVGDLVDRGPDVPGALRTAMRMVAAGTALAVAGNHEVKLAKHLAGKSVKPTHGLAQSIEQLEREPEAFRRDVAAFVDSLVSHYVLDGGRLVVAHAGLAEHLQGRASGRVRQFALYGETTGETDDLGLPVRTDWARSYRGSAAVIYGHTPVLAPRWVNHTLCIDTGCVFGGSLTALRWPERELVSVGAKRVHYEPVRPLAAAPQERARDVLDLQDVSGKRRIDTRYAQPVAVREQHAAAALEAMSRFAIDPRWLVYLPPTMSPPESSAEPGYLEHPREAFAYYRDRGVARVICEEKHMGSRAVVVLCRDLDVARERFGTSSVGAIHTRTGRPFFGDARDTALLERLRDAAERARLFDELASGWLVIDAEILPWSAKAQGLVREQYEPVASAGIAALRTSVELLERTPGAEELAERSRRRLARVERYAQAYTRYAWEVDGIEGLAVAPFHLLASEGGVHADRDHGFHLAMLARLAEHDPMIRATPHRIVDLDDAQSERAATEWWLEATAAGAEGMVVKPTEWLCRYEQGLVQPAIKCRGREYLRIIYGPEYTDEAHLARLRARALGGKRRLAIAELTLGLEALARFVGGEPLHRVHECVFGILALESEPVDPRL